MNLQSLIGGDFRVSVDSRASKRDIGEPSEITTESSFFVGKRGEVINLALRSEVVPVALVDADSTIWLLTSGKSGLVMFESADNNPIDDRQASAVTAVVSALELLFNIDSAPKAKKPRVKKQSETELELQDVPEENEISIDVEDDDDTLE